MTSRTTKSSGDAQSAQGSSPKVCWHGHGNHDHNAAYCWKCGERLAEPGDAQSAQGSSPSPETHTALEQALAVVVAANALISDWAAGGHQAPRSEPCGDDQCGYAACELAVALRAFSPQKSTFKAPCSDRLTEIEERVNAVEHGNALGGSYAVNLNDARWLLARVRVLETALVAASDDARILIQDYYSGLPEHRAPVDGAVARLAHLFERDDQECEPRTVDEIVTDGLPARAAIALTAAERGVL